MPRQKKLNIEMGERIKQLRDGRPQTAIAGVAGITQGMWSKCEDGNLPDIDILYRISKALGTSVEYLWGNIKPHNIVSDLGVSYRSEEKYPADLQHIIDEWPDLCETQKAAVVGVLDAFSKQDSNSLKLSENSE